MRHLLFLSCMIAVGCAAGERNAGPGDAPTTQPQTIASKPFFDARSHTTEYAGPGREAPTPDGVREVEIGYFGPDDPEHITAGQMWQAAMLAVEEANQAGGYDGLPFRLVAAWSENRWGTGVKGVTRLVYEHRVWALIGAPDGPSAHLAAQVVAKARLPLVSTVSTDKTVNLVNVPWVFSCPPGDHLLAAVLAEAVAARAGERDLAVISCTDHDSRLFTTELLAALHRRQVFPAVHVRFIPGDTDFDRQLRSLPAAPAAAVALIAGPRDAARCLIALRRNRPDLPVFGGPAMGRDLFVEAAGAAAEGVVYPLLWRGMSGDERAAAFARRFEQRFGHSPDYAAAHTYDGMQMLIASIRAAGLNRALIRDALRDLSPWAGVTGTITWDPTGHNRRPVTLGVIGDREVTGG